MRQFKIRCSAIGQIMGEPRTKAAKEAGELSQTAKTYCKQWLKEQLYKRRKEFSSKYTDKGNIMEDNSLDFVAEQLGYGMLIKNESHYSNDFMQGTPDAILPKLIIDVKNSWDFSTFPLLETEIPTKDYIWQAQGYLALLDKNDFKLCYVLSDTPQHLIQREAYWYAKNNGYEDLDQELYEQFEKRMTYPDIPDSLKLKTFDIKRDDEAIKRIESRVMKCRAYIETLLKTLNN
jgi:hypothetical protein